MDCLRNLHCFLLALLQSFELPVLLALLELLAMLALPASLVFLVSPVIIENPKMVNHSLTHSLTTLDQEMLTNEVKPSASK